MYTNQNTNTCMYVYIHKAQSYAQTEANIHAHTHEQASYNNGVLELELGSLSFHYSHTFIHIWNWVHVCMHVLALLHKKISVAMFFFIIIFPWLGLVFFNFILVRCVYITSLKTQALLILLQQQCLPIPVLLQEGKDNTVGSHTSFRFALEKKMRTWNLIFPRWKLYYVTWKFSSAVWFNLEVLRGKIDR